MYILCCFPPPPDHPGIDNTPQIERFQEKAYTELQDYVTTTYPEDSYRSVSFSLRLCFSSGWQQFDRCTLLTPRPRPCNPSSVCQAVQAAAASPGPQADQRRRHRGALLLRPHRQRADRQHHPLHPQDGVHRLQQPGVGGGLRGPAPRTLPPTAFCPIAPLGL